jgi:hypothetical protein
MIMIYHLMLIQLMLLIESNYLVNLKENNLKMV